METWGSWTFGEENKHLLTETLDKIRADECNLRVDIQNNFLSALIALPKVSIYYYLYHMCRYREPIRKQLFTDLEVKLHIKL